MNVRLLCTCFAGFGASISSFAQIWDGGAGTGAWGTALNWNPDEVPTRGANVLFDGAYANNQDLIDLGAGQTTAGLIFIDATGLNPFTFGGDRINLGAQGIQNLDRDTQTFNADINLTVNQVWDAGSGLAVKNGTVRAMANKSFVGSAPQVTSLDLTGGSLVLNDGLQPRTVTFEGGANLIGGVLDGGGAPAGTLVIGGNLVHDSTTLVNAPNVTMNVAGPASISGTAITGAGIFTKQGAGTVTLQTGLTATRIDIDAGTLLVGGNNLIGNTTGIRLNGGTLGINGTSDTVGILTLAANSTIDFGTSGSSTWIFGNSTAPGWTSGSVLTIANWDGQWFGGGSDRLVFGSITASQLTQIRFLNPNGLDGTFNARILPNGEIVPVPEPATIGFGALLLGSLGYRERKRVAGFFGALRKKLAAS